MPKKTWYHDGVHFECARSGKCCTAHGAYDRVYLDDGEAEVVADLLGLSLAELEREHCWFEDDSRLIRFEDGACRFLDGTSCAIYAARPIQCRTWPFWPGNLAKRTWKKDVEAFCPGVGRGRHYSRAEIDAIAAQVDE